MRRTSKHTPFSGVIYYEAHRVIVCFQMEENRIQNIFVGLLCIMALVAAIWGNKGSFEKKNEKNDKNDKEGKNNQN